MNNNSRIEDGILGKRFCWHSIDTNYELDVRNIGERNKEHSIQFSLNRWKDNAYRNMPYVSFSIPIELAEEFLNTINNVEKQKGR